MQLPLVTMQDFNFCISTSKFIINTELFGHLAWHLDNEGPVIHILHLHEYGLNLFKEQNNKMTKQSDQTRLYHQADSTVPE